MKHITHDFKNSEAAKGFLSLDIELLKIIPYMIEWCNKNSVPFVVTRALSENIEDVSKSNTHPEGRAVDVSVKGWTADKIYEFEAYWNAHGFCKSYGAVSAKDGVARLVVYHSGVGFHLHLQVKKS